VQAKIKIQAIYRAKSTQITMQAFARTREKASAQEQEGTGERTRKEQERKQAAEQ
jgi:hypothetical protein